MDARAIRQLREVQVFLDAGQHEIAGPVDRPVPARAGVGEGDDPFHLRCVLFQEADAHGDGAALTVSREHAVKGHSVQFQELVPAGALHKADDLAFIQRRSVAHDAVELAVEENAEMEFGIAHDLAGVVVRSDERVGNIGGEHLHHNFFSAAHSLTTSYSPFPL
ncbi:hypothetical protein SDC9_183415 [bioreactor metagenome]|uniref:Uncharacterized protein n=1 Tax=bioreactor metagenome TaxID=1076179 RepID=A0A645HC17_9ZZZZ